MAMSLPSQKENLKSWSTDPSSGLEAECLELPLVIHSMD